jgi:hypothetical protein
MLLARYVHFATSSCRSGCQRSQRRATWPPAPPPPKSGSSSTSCLTSCLTRIRTSAPQTQLPWSAPARAPPVATELCAAAWAHDGALVMRKCGYRGPDGLPEDLRHLQALALLERGWPGGTSDPLYLQEHVLHLCHYYSFKDGLLFLFRRMHDVTRQLQVCTASRTSTRLLPPATAGTRQPCTAQPCARQPCARQLCTLPRWHGPCSMKDAHTSVPSALHTLRMQRMRGGVGATRGMSTGAVVTMNCKH